MLINLSFQLKKMIDLTGLTVSELSRQSGVPKQTITDWLAGTEPRRISQVKKVANLLGVTVDELVFGGVDEKPVVPIIPPPTEGSMSASIVGSDGGEIVCTETADGVWTFGPVSVKLRPLKNGGRKRRKRANTGGKSE